MSQTDDVKMAFAIYSDDTGLTAGPFPVAPSGDARKWTSWDSTGEGRDDVDSDKTIGVQVRNGRFLVNLGEAGEQQPLSDLIFDDPKLYVVTWVVRSDQEIYRLPPQKIERVPYAISALRVRQRVLYQIKEAGTNCSALRFDNIEAGKTYRLSITMLKSSDVASGYLAMRYNGRTMQSYLNGNPGFTATSQYLFTGVEGQTSITCLELRNVGETSSVTLEELPFHQPTTQW